MHDVESGKPVFVSRSSVCYNACRRQWILIGVESPGTSNLGEIWFAQAQTPTGPWHWARKIVTHDKYTFYNPTQQPFFDQEGARVIYFEGTYVDTFSGNPCLTPRLQLQPNHVPAGLERPPAEDAAEHRSGRGLHGIAWDLNPIGNGRGTRRELEKISGHIAPLPEGEGGRYSGRVRAWPTGDSRINAMFLRQNSTSFVLPRPHPAGRPATLSRRERGWRQ